MQCKKKVLNYSSGLFWSDLYIFKPPLIAPTNKSNMMGLSNGTGQGGCAGPPQGWGGPIPIPDENP